MVTHLGIVENAKDEESKYPFLVGAPFSMQLENAHQLIVYYSKTSKSLTYSIYDESMQVLKYKQPLRSFPSNLSADSERVLFFANGYLIDESASKFSLANTEQSRESWIELIKQYQIYLGD